MIPGKNTLDAKEFTQVIKKGKNYKGKFFFIKTLDNNVGYTRVGVGMSKKLTKRTVDRNYYKRLLRHVVKETLPSFKKNLDIVIIGQENIKGVNFENLKNDAKNIFNKAKII